MSRDEEERELVQLNEQFAAQEQRGEDARGFFQRHLSDQLVFRRADGSVVGKGGTLGTKGFLESLSVESPFASRLAEDIAVTLRDGQALVTLVVHTVKKDGTQGRYRNIRLFSKRGDDWVLDFWYNYDLTSL
jgi:hypothetical protein